MIALLAAAAAFGGGGAEPAAEVLISESRFSPSRVSLLAGESLVWRNRDHRRHTITARGAFDSGSLAPGEEFSRRFDEPGTYRYLCTVHRAMTGSVEVAGIALEAPREPVPAGETATLTGRAPAGTAGVVLERDGVPIAETHAGEGGGFSFTLAPERPAGYRARAGGLSSAAVFVPVAPEVRLAARRHGRFVSVRVHVPAGAPGSRVAIERYRRERFGFVRARPRALRLDRDSRAHARLRLPAAVRLRARIAIPTGGWARSTSPEVTVPARSGTAPARHPHHP